MRGFVLLVAGAISLTPMVAGAQQSPVFSQDSELVQLDRHVLAPERVRALCDTRPAASFNQLIRQQDDWADSVTRHKESANAWYQLACRRALLFAMGSPGQAGTLMVAGQSWASASVDEVLEALKRDAANEGAARLLAVMAPEDIPTTSPAGLESDVYQGPPYRPAGTPATGTAVAAAAAIYRAVRLGVHSPDVMRACTSLMFDTGDAATGHDCSVRALALGQDSTWHLLRLTWLAALRNDTTTMKQMFEAAMAAAHDPVSRAQIGWHFEHHCTKFQTCRTEGLLDGRLSTAERAHWVDATDTTAQQWFATRLAENGRGDTTRYWADPAPCCQYLLGSVYWSGLARRLVAHFHTIAYAGGSFRDCLNTLEPCWGVLTPYGTVPMDVVAQLDHLWDPVTGAPVDVVPYMLVGNDLNATGSSNQRTALVHLDLRRWGAGMARDTTLTLSLGIPPHTNTHPSFTGVVVMPSQVPFSAWSLMATQEAGGHGGLYQDAKPPLDDGPLALSDLVIGAPSQQLSWHAGDHDVALAPQGVVLRTEPVELYFQVKSDSARAGSRMTLVVYADGVARTTSNPALQVESDLPLHAGLNEIVRTVDLSHLASGKYWIEARIVDARRNAVAARGVMAYTR